ncbi:MAG: nucleoside deaminase [Bacteroidales bacterium]|nr:nucleoside deaminase [Bacteroidales bacterium]
MSKHEAYLKLAIDEASVGIKAGEGGPFGALIVKDGKIIGKGHNTVLKSHDPTAHAEVNAIRNACRNVKEHHLTDAVIYSNFEPCPMCLAAIYWADIRTLYFCAGHDEAEKIGFMDKILYEEISLPMEKRKMKSARIVLQEMASLLDEWNRMDRKILY